MLGFTCKAEALAVVLSEMRLLAALCWQLEYILLLPVCQPVAVTLRRFLSVFSLRCSHRFPDSPLTGAFFLALLKNITQIFQRQRGALLKNLSNPNPKIYHFFRPCVFSSFLLDFNDISMIFSSVFMSGFSCFYSYQVNSAQQPSHA